MNVSSKKKSGLAIVQELYKLSIGRVVSLRFTLCLKHQSDKFPWQENHAFCLVLGGISEACPGFRTFPHNAHTIPTTTQHLPWQGPRPSRKAFVQPQTMPVTTKW